ncbi:amyloid fiber anchoring/assembly protein TapA [Virgibacillus sp. MG-45]|uniref:amyloid fiber anchoring/assembly protein TapA n=1 Tax=Virgibacillus sp. MG-45 TaxID=3102791 RepID=UPI002EDA1496
MRLKRYKKFQKRYRRTKVGFQLLLVWACVLLAGTYFNTYTNASFNDIEDVSNYLHVDWEQEEEPGDPDEEWDKSSLVAMEGDGSFGFTCNSGTVELFSMIKNKEDSSDMAGPSTFDIQYAPFEEKGPNNGHPGETIYSGEIPALESGETVTLRFSANELRPGKYKFKAYQRPGHPGNSTPWGGMIELTVEDLNNCLGNQTTVNTPDKEQFEEKNEKQKESEPKTKKNEANEEVVVPEEGQIKETESQESPAEKEPNTKDGNEQEGKEEASNIGGDDT